MLANRSVTQRRFRHRFPSNQRVAFPNAAEPRGQSGRYGRVPYRSRGRLRPSAERLMSDPPKPGSGQRWRANPSLMIFGVCRIDMPYVAGRITTLVVAIHVRGANPRRRYEADLNAAAAITLCRAVRPTNRTLGRRANHYLGGSDSCTWSQSTKGAMKLT